jgi:hypothetical protein
MHLPVSLPHNPNGAIVFASRDITLNFDLLAILR